MKVARSLLVALAAFGAVTATVAQPPGPVTPPACQMACHKGEYAKIQACGSDADCIAQVKASIASCMAACPPSSSTPNGAMVGDFTCSAKCVVKYGSCAVTCTAGDMTCYATCGATYAACSDACGPAAIEAEPMSEPEPEVKSMATPVSWGPDCDGPCYDKELQCYNACAGEQACQLKCVQTYSACCASQSKAPTMVADRPMKPTECVANCKAALNRCYTNVENWCSPTVWGASCKGQGRMQCMLTDTDCCVDCQRLPAAKVAAVAPAKKPTQVGFYSCQACTGDYSQCFNECPAGDAHCLNSCVNMFMGCMGQCEIDSVKASVASTVGATPVGDAKKQTLCRMACIGVDAAAKSACQHWMPGSTLCLENVADARQMCDIGCGLLEVSAVAPTASNNREVCEEHCTEGENEAFQACGQSLNCISGVQAQVNNCVASCAKLPETKLPVAASGCEAGCNSEYNQCVKSGSSPTTCFRQQNKCFDICHMRLASAESATMPALVAITAAKHELKGIPCAAACLVSQKTASLLCYAYPENLKKPCFDHLDDALSVCQFLCTFSPVMAEAPKQAIEAPKTEKAVVGSDCTSACWAADTACDAKCKATCKGSFNACFSSCSTQCWWAGSDCTKKCDSSPTLGAGVAVGATPVGDAKKQTLCRMACIGVDAAAKSACQHWMPGSTLCLENVADARQMCDIGCGLLEAPAMSPKLKGTACEASCNADYKGCMKLLGSSYSKCTRDQTACFKLCHQSVASPLRRVAAAAQSRVGDAECAKCAASLKDCFMGCNFDAQCSGRCFSNDWQCQLSC